ncbi:elongation of very long chain fatty acids protein AAEL008004 isoform X2 [Bradysia coprophila]|uniref:elongation of very long chain fatty acids protein AAEL008004 isoform X2 n=1 Tax=Bradysia coprophila TaxID=38358 RepID=UPI00187DA535|nr:elongation of very long chain fatty acids protein AAEL008004 isoform X2 [Bradysia coprophila]XP_037030824.1 elongation of very long chain fatty acids protein AAEL008004 isoform X2 [Bradysia coprophila]XP_037030825.1 elongation of very long chain fatty acids protein AAEL008004 isoform X2 [Bradysia coprophila]XP_037030826.1 elongation of very long chain fatty acids protein AAEL008004 isoform X2 [Bradysia coprophila]XP_037030827.1 elongation of very long chain fatty acids protein AAEL008004 iso
MALIMRYIDSMQRYMDSYGDPRTKDWPMMSSPFPTLAVCLSYVYIVKVLGPKIMENRKPFQLQNTLIVYNFIQVIFSAWLFYEISISGWLTGHYNFRCQPVDYSNHPKTLRMVHACWWYYFSKFTEFMDTIFFVMRKKTSQVTTLHVIHHGCMPMSVWFGVKFTPGGHSTFFGLLNTFVHIVMYTYYMFAAMGPQYQRFLWWKKYLTALQMVQFVAIMVHAFQLLFIDCNYPRAFVWWIGMHAVMFFFLFNEFYKSTYKAKQDRLRREAEQKKNDTLKNGLKQNGSIKENGVNANGTMKHQNGVIHSNGAVHKHENGNGVANGSLNHKTDYSNIDSPTDLTRRKVQK